MFDILLIGVVWEGMVVVKGKVVEMVRLTGRYCVARVGSTGVLLEWSVDKRDCSEEWDGDSLYVLLRASSITFFLPSICSLVMSG